MGSSVYTVKQGECMTLIAHRHGFADWKRIYQHPDNAELRQKRPDPNVLWPGDQVVIPDPESPEYPRVTDKRHRFVLHRPTKKLHLVFQLRGGRPLAGLPYELSVEGMDTVAGKTDGDGAVKHDIPVEALKGTIKIGGVVRDLAIGHLDPMTETRRGGLNGIQARLKNLGYNPGNIDGEWDLDTWKAIREFQHDHDLPVDGKLTDALRDKLGERHGG